MWGSTNHQKAENLVQPHCVPLVITVWWLTWSHTMILTAQLDPTFPFLLILASILSLHVSTSCLWFSINYPSTRLSWISTSWNVIWEPLVAPAHQEVIGKSRWWSQESAKSACPGHVVGDWSRACDADFLPVFRWTSPMTLGFVQNGAPHSSDKASSFQNCSLLMGKSTICGTKPSIRLSHVCLISH